MQDFVEIIDQADAMPPSAAKVQLLEEACRLADTAGDIEGGYVARGMLVKAASWMGKTPESLAAFTWQLGQADADPRRFPEKDLFFEYQWVISDCVDVPTIPRSEVEQMLDDLQTRLLRNNVSLRSVSHLRWRMAMRMGRFDEAVEEQKRWRNYPTDNYCFDDASERDSEVELLIAMRKDKEALEHAAPILSGELRSGNAVPHFALGNLLVCCVRAGKLNDASKLHKWGYSLIRADQSQLHQHCRHLLYLIWTGSLLKAFNMFELQLPRFADSANPGERAAFQWASGLLLRRMAATEKTLSLRVPPACPFHRPDGTYDTMELSETFLSGALDVAKSFDQRNGNDWFVHTYREEERLAMDQGVR